MQVKNFLIFILLLFFLVSIVYAGNKPKPGDKAPDFTLTTHKGEIIRLKDFIGQKYIVLFFYPGNNTPVCTKQLCEVRDNYGEFIEKDAVIFGINSGKIGSQVLFAKKHNFPFELLLDESRKVIKLYGVKGFYFDKRMVFVIDKTGKIIYRKKGKPPISEILNFIP